MPDQITSTGDGADSVANTPESTVLSEVALFRGLPAEELSKIEARVRRRTLPAGAHVITVEEPGDTVYVVLEGSVKVYVTRPDGSEVILAILGAGEIVGEMSVADSLGRSANVTTLEETSFLLLDRRSFRASVEELPTMALNLTNILSRRLRLANAHLRSVAAMDVPGRVAAQLLALTREYGEPSPRGGTLIPLPLTQSDLAGLVGASRVRVNQAIAFFKKRRYLSVGTDRRITVHDADSLARPGRQCRFRSSVVMSPGLICGVPPRLDSVHLVYVHLIE
jgi:CRP/FNR family transcriptional regulator, cyclic AMP receptor protein